MNVPGIRGQAALVRSLLDELDRIVPPSGSRRGEDTSRVLREQLAEEIVRLGSRLLDCAEGLGPVPRSGASR